MTITVTHVEALRQGWEDAVASVAPGVDELPLLVETRVDQAARENRLDERSLLAVVDEAWRVAARRIPPPDAAQLARRMQQSIYEFLLSLDAIVVHPDDGSEDSPAPSALATMIGLEEVASEAPAVESPAVEAALEPEAPADTAAPAAEVDVDLEAAPADQPAAPEDEAEPQAVPAEPAEPARRRFTLFRRNGAAMSFDPEPVTAEATPAMQPPAPPPYVAPRDGFHIMEPPLAPQEPPASEPAPEAVVPETPAPERALPGAAAPPDDEPAADSRSWRIRNLRPRKRQRAQETAAAELAEEDELDDDVDDLQPTGSASRFETDPDVVEARRQINDRLRHRRCDEAASLLQRLASDVGGKEVAELALDAGDRCRALGKANAALSCYLAASRADPVHETPLLRLADICLDDKDIDLAVSYLERVARLHRLRGDSKGALRVYRKIATVAPYRDDVLNLLMRVQATGRFDEDDE